jgi:hypothetical protein
MKLLHRLHSPVSGSSELQVSTTSPMAAKLLFVSFCNRCFVVKVMLCLLYEVTNSMEHSTAWEAVIRLVKKYPAFYGTHMFIPVFTKARH